MRSASRLVLAVLLSGMTVLAQTGPPPAMPKERAELDVTKLLMQGTVRIEGPDGTGGTGFILHFSESPLQMPVLITAAHVLEGIGDAATIVIRTRTQEGKWARMDATLPLRVEGQTRYFRHPDADVAALYINIHPTMTPEDYLSTTFLASDVLLEQHDVRTGDEAFTLSYPHGILANEEGFATLRGCHIASYPMLPTLYMRSFVLDFEVHEGEAGAPVFVRRDSVKEKDGTMKPIPGHFGLIIGMLGNPPFSSARFLRLAVAIPASIIKETLVLLLEADEKKRPERHRVPRS